MQENNIHELISNSISYIKEYEPQAGYHLAFSGGKDSIVLKQLTIMSGVKYNAYFYLTTIDPPDVLQFVRKYYDDVTFLHPNLSMFQLIVKKGLPTRQSRFCCHHLKECHGSGSTVLTGIRHSESYKRSQRSLFEISKYDDTKSFVNPIIHWSESDVWKFIKAYHLPFPDLYLGCQTRIGCIGCPMAPKRMRTDFILYPKFKYAYMKAITKAMQRGIMQSFNSPEEAFNWWISGKSVKQFRADALQLSFFTQS